MRLRLIGCFAQFAFRWAEIAGTTKGAQTALHQNATSK